MSVIKFGVFFKDQFHEVFQEWCWDRRFRLIMFFVIYIYWQTTLIPSSWGMFVKSKQTSKVTRIAFSRSWVFSMKFIKWVVSLMYDSCFLAIGCKSEATNLEIRSVGPPLPGYWMLAIQSRYPRSSTETLKRENYSQKEKFIHINTCLSVG